MMGHARTLVNAWGGGTVILSPRDLNPSQLDRHSIEITKRGGRVLLDPQFFLPHADHKRLCSHSYWPAMYDTALFWYGPSLGRLIDSLRDLNAALRTTAFILPGLLAQQVDSDWLACQEAIAVAAAAAAPGVRRLMTVALSAEAARSADQVHDVLEASVNWPVDGLYLVCEHPRGMYLVEDAMWLATVLDLVAGWQLRGREVVIGYSSHQMLIAGAAKATAIASGTWLNVRSFPPEKFNQPDDEERRKSVWYYAPRALSEFKIDYLDLAHRQGLLDRIAPDPALGSTFASALFGGPQPSSVGLAEPEAFRHYLHSLHGQAAAAVRSTFDETADAHERLLDQAEIVLTELHNAGVRGLKRDFEPILQVNRSALQVLRTTRGTILRRRWGMM